MFQGDIQARARLSHGASEGAVHDLVATALAERQLEGVSLLDVGCGKGGLFLRLHDRLRRYVGADVVRYEGFPEARAEFVQANLEESKLPFQDACFDVV